MSIGQSSQHSVFSKWISEYCAPVVITTATAEAETICMRNGLLFHELLSAFGHLDGLNACIRYGNQIYSIPDAHIRFERSTEVKARSVEVVDQLIRDNFKEFDISRLPSNIAELKSSQPTAWSQQIEQMVARLMSFSEYEMISHPYSYLAVVATTDVDHVACMQELVSSHHTPSCMNNGQYDPGMVQRAFVLLHDANQVNMNSNPNDILRTLKAAFPNESVRMLTINSFPLETPNFQQPDMWSKFLIPRFFPDHIPQLDNTAAAKNPVTGEPAIGSLLTMEDFMNLRDFCVTLYTQSIVPNIERRLALLHKQVNDARKGVRNVLKSFWRKPREETDNTKGGLKYRHDKIESQIQLLAATAFIMKDFETALSMYKLVRDDFKADKCVIHFACTCLMMAASQTLLDASKMKEIHSHLEALGAVLANCSEFPHANAYFSLLAAEMYVVNYSTRAPLQSAQILLQGATNVAQRSAILSGLLVERAAGYFLQANQSRRYVFHIVIAGNRLHKCGFRPSRHAAVCFAASMLLLDKGMWGDLKSKLSRALAKDLKYLGREGAQRSLLLMLKMLSASICGDTNDVGNTAALSDAVNVFHEVTAEGAWGSIVVEDGWRECTTRDILLNPLPVHPQVVGGNSDGLKLHTEVFGLQIPQLDMNCTSLIQPLNGDELDALFSDITVSEQNMAEEMRRFLEMEIEFMQQYAKKGGMGGDCEETLADKWAQLEVEMARARDGNSNLSNAFANADISGIVRIPLGEDVKVRLRLNNKLPIDLQLTKVRLCPTAIGTPTSARHNNLGAAIGASADATASAATAGEVPSLISEMHSDSLLKDSFHMEDVDVLVVPDVANELVLRASPRKVGKYRVDSVRWNLSEYFSVQQSLQRDGPLLQKTQQQRANRVRGEDSSLSFEVVPEHPNLKLIFDGLSQEVLQGQLLKSTLLVRNEGAAPACDIFIKMSQPAFVFYLSASSAKDNSTIHEINNYTTDTTRDRWIKFFGGSSTVLSLGENTTIAPGEELRFEAWLGLSQLGMQKVSLLASYKALRPDGSHEPFGPGNRCRTSFLSVQTNVVPSLGISLRLVPRSSSSTRYSLITEISNFLQPINDADLASPSFEIGDGVRERLSSVGQLDLPKLSENFSEVEENDIKIMGIWMLGAARTTSHQPAIAEKKSLLTSPSERFSHCFTVRREAVMTLEELKNDLEDRRDEALSRSGSRVKARCSWLLPLPEQEKDISTAPISTLSNEHIMQVVEQFLCIANARHHFEREVESSLQLVLAEEREAEVLGPRSIAQVRRDKQAQLERQNESLNGGILPVKDLISSTEQEHMRLLSKDSITAQDVAESEAEHQSVAIATVWLCQWEGKLRWGLHSAQRLSFYGDKRSVSVGDSTAAPVVGTSTKVSNVSNKRKQIPSKPADCLLVNIEHPSSSQLCSGLEVGIHLPVTVLLTSLATSQRLIVSVSAVDLNMSISHMIESHSTNSAAHQRPSIANQAPRGSFTPERHLSGAMSAPNLSVRESYVSTNSPSAADDAKSLLVEGNYSVAMNEDVSTSLRSPIAVSIPTPVEKSTNLGLRWNGKTHFSGITLEAGATTQLNLSAFISKAGVYDLNRFYITVRFANGQGPAQIKKVRGQSLVDVMFIE